MSVREATDEDTRSEGARLVVELRDSSFTRLIKLKIPCNISASPKSGGSRTQRLALCLGRIVPHMVALEKRACDQELRLSLDGAGSCSTASVVSPLGRADVELRTRHAFYNQRVPLKKGRQFVSSISKIRDAVASLCMTVGDESDHNPRWSNSSCASEGMA